MRAMVFDGNAPVLQMLDVPDPMPRAGELLIDVHACGVPQSTNQRHSPSAGAKWRSRLGFPGSLTVTVQASSMVVARLSDAHDHGAGPLLLTTVHVAVGLAVKPSTFARHCEVS